MGRESETTRGDSERDCEGGEERERLGDDSGRDSEMNRGEDRRRLRGDSETRRRMEKGGGGGEVQQATRHTDEQAMR